jgi:hypothetical protein
LSFGVVRSAAEASVLARFGAAGFTQRLEGKIGVQLRDCSFLQSFSCLRELHLTCEDERFPGGRSLARSLECLTELRVLDLKAATLSTDQLIDALASMPNLRALTLYHSWMPSLSFIALADVRGRGALSASLRLLEFNRLRAVHGRDVLWYLRGLRALRTLRLDFCFVGRALPAEEVAQLRALVQENKTKSAAQIRRDEAAVQAAALDADCELPTAVVDYFPLLTEFSFQKL